MSSDLRTRLVPAVVYLYWRSSCAIPHRTPHPYVGCGGEVKSSQVVATGVKDQIRSSISLFFTFTLSPSTAFSLIYVWSSGTSIRIVMLYENTRIRELFNRL